uniref:Pentatricopeptide repeat-containing protein n=1 Tax=Ananas comosus var. bracteatus TaxID=296719 RepID=A0A6V7QTZ1_ANACO
MIDILSSTRYKAGNSNCLRYFGSHEEEKQEFGPLDGLLTILKTYTEKHLTHLRKFAKKKRIRMKTPPEIDAFNILLDALCKCSLVKEAELMFHRVKNKLVPNAETYNILFFGWCRVRDPKKAMKVLEEMLERVTLPRISHTMRRSTLSVVPGWSLKRESYLSL